LDRSPLQLADACGRALVCCGSPGSSLVAAWKRTARGRMSKDASCSISVRFAIGGRAPTDSWTRRNSLIWVEPPSFFSQRSKLDLPGSRGNGPWRSCLRARRAGSGTGTCARHRRASPWLQAHSHDSGAEARSAAGRRSPREQRQVSPFSSAISRGATMASLRPKFRECDHRGPNGRASTKTARS